MNRHGFVAVAVLSTLPTACAKKEAESKANLGTSPVQGHTAPSVEAVPRPDAITDELITAAVRRRLAKSDAVPGQRVRVSTNDGVVTLAGRVPHLLARDAAVQITRATRGVTSVVDRLEVLPSARSDREIVTAVEASLADSKAVDAGQVQVESKEGAVTLRGKVASFVEQQAAESAAKATRGVRSVKNEVVATMPNHRPDSEILADVTRRLGLDTRIDADHLHIDVDDGKVALSGTIPSEAQRYRAWQKSWVAGVQDVDDDGVHASAALEDEMAREKPGPAPSAGEIEKVLRTAVASDPRISPTVPSIEVSDGTVTLRGVVATMEARQAAADTAWNTLGVRRVRNYLEVKPSVMLADIDLARRVEAALDRDPYVGVYDIKVTAHNGKVTLYGKVHTDFDREQAEAVVRGLVGPVEVANQLAADAVASENPFPMDWKIRQDVVDCLFWDADVDYRRVDVEVEGGVVRLSGRVRSRAAYDAARDCAHSVFRFGLEDRMTILPPLLHQADADRHHAQL